MDYRVRFYASVAGEKPVVEFLEGLLVTQPDLHRLVIAGIRKRERRDRHGPPLTALVDPQRGIFELRVGFANIARVFFFFRPNQEIVLTNGYVKKGQKVDRAELARARRLMADWEARDR